jgi:hypothetical protein
MNVIPVAASCNSFPCRHKPFIMLMMEVPRDTVVYETPMASVWIHNDIVYVHCKNVERQSKAATQHFELLNEKATGKHCFLVNLNRICVHYDKATTLMIEKHYSNLSKAVALVAQTPCEELISHFFMKLRNLNIPVASFRNVEDAEIWLQQYLK